MMQSFCDNSIHYTKAEQHFIRSEGAITSSLLKGKMVDPGGMLRRILILRKRDYDSATLDFYCNWRR